MIVTANRTCVLLASEDMITQRIDAHLAGAKRATVSVCNHLGVGRSETAAEKSLPNLRWETSYRLEKNSKKYDDGGGVIFAQVSSISQLLFNRLVDRSRSISTVDKDSPI